MYAFRNTYKLDQDTFVEDRGAPFYVRRGDELFNTLAQKFADLPVGYNAKRGSEGDYWDYEAGWPALEEAKSAKLAEIKQAYHDAEEHGYTTSSLGFVVDATRRSMIGTGDRSEKIRTYNYPQSRVTDHRIGKTLYTLDAFLNGNIGGLIAELVAFDMAERLKGEQ